jgi:hypothetical protein
MSLPCLGNCFIDVSIKNEELTVCTVKKNLFIILALEFAEANTKPKDKKYSKRIFDLLREETNTAETTKEIIREVADLLSLDKKSQKQIQEEAEDMTFIHQTSQIKKYISRKEMPPLYRDRKNKSQNPIDFLNEHWGLYLKEGTLYQDQLGKIDPELLTSLKGVLYRNENCVPPKTNRIKKINKVITHLRAA